MKLEAVREKGGRAGLPVDPATTDIAGQHANRAAYLSKTVEIAQDAGLSGEPRFICPADLASETDLNPAMASASPCLYEVSQEIRAASTFLRE